MILNYLAIPFDITPEASNGTFTVDLTGKIPAGSVAIVQIKNPTTIASENTARYVGDTTSYGNIEDKASTQFYAPLDSNNEIELIKNNDNISFYLIGYISGGTWFNSPVSLTIPSGSGFGDVDITSHVGADAGNIECAFVLLGSSSKDDVRLRAKGSTDVINVSGFTVKCYPVKIDDNNIFEYDRNTVSDPMYLIGYAKRSSGITAPINAITFSDNKSIGEAYPGDFGLSDATGVIGLVDSNIDCYCYRKNLEVDSFIRDEKNAGCFTITTGNVGDFVYDKITGPTGSNINCLVYSTILSNKMGFINGGITLRNSVEPKPPKEGSFQLYSELGTILSKFPNGEIKDIFNPDAIGKNGQLQYNQEGRRKGLPNSHYDADNNTLELGNLLLNNHLAAKLMNTSQTEAMFSECYGLCSDFSRSLLFSAGHNTHDFAVWDISDGGFKRVGYLNSGLNDRQNNMIHHNGFVYITSQDTSGASSQVVNVKDPTNPFIVQTVSHGGTIKGNTFKYHNGNMFMTSTDNTNTSRLHIFDIDQEGQLTQIGVVAETNSRVLYGIEIFENYAYSHSANTKELCRFDITNLASPTVDNHLILSGSNYHSFARSNRKLYCGGQSGSLTKVDIDSFTEDSHFYINYSFESLYVFDDVVYGLGSAMVVVDFSSTPRLLTSYTERDLGYHNVILDGGNLYTVDRAGSWGTSNTLVKVEIGSMKLLSILINNGTITNLKTNIIDAEEINVKKIGADKIKGRVQFEMMTTSERTSLTLGLNEITMVYDTDLNGLYLWNGTSWGAV